MKKNMKRAIEVGVLLTIVLAIGVGVSNAYNIYFGAAVWDATSSTQQLTVNGASAGVLVGTNPNSLPPSIPFCGIATISLNPDYKSASDNGMIPQVDFYIGQLKQVDRDTGAQSTITYPQPDSQGSHWMEVYYQIQFGVFTNAGTSSLLSGFGGFALPESDEVSVTAYVGITLSPNYSAGNESLESGWAGGTIVATQEGAIPNHDGSLAANFQDEPNLGGLYDISGEANPTLGNNAQLSLFTTKASGNGWQIGGNGSTYIFAVGGHLRPAVRFNYILLRAVNVNTVWDSGFIQTAQFGVLVSRPITMDNITVKDLASPDRSRTENTYDIFGFLATWFGGLGDFFKFIIIAAVVLIGLYLIVHFRRKRILLKKA